MILISLLVSDFQIFAKAVPSRYRAVLVLIYYLISINNLAFENPISVLNVFYGATIIGREKLRSKTRKLPTF